MTGPLFPGNYSQVWIRGRFITMAGVAVRGKLTLAPTVAGGALVNRSAKLIMSSAPFSADSDNDGYVALQVPATNDPDITPINFTYSVTTPIGQKFSIVVPYDTTPLNSVGDPLHGQPVIELIDMVPVGSSGGVGQLLRGIGIQSMVDNGAGGLLITYSDLSTTTIAMPDTVAGPAGPVGPQGPLGPVGPTGPASSIASATDLDTAGTAVGKVPAVSEVTGGIPSAFELATVPPVGGEYRPINLPVPTAMVTTFAPGHGWSATGTAAGTNLNDTGTFSTGTQSVKVVTDGANGAAYIDKTGLNLDLTGKLLRIKYRIDDFTRIDQLIVYAGDTGLTNNYMWTIGANEVGGFQYTRGGEWAYLTLPFPDAALTGTPVRSAITNLRLRSRDNSAGPLTVWWDEVAVVKDQVVWPNGVVTLAFDDCDASVWSEAVPKLSQYGFPGTIFSIRDVVDTAGYLTLAQMHTAEREFGWEVAAHSDTLASHAADFTNLTADALLDDLRAQRHWLADQGFRGRDHIAYPKGGFNANTLPIIKQVYASGRTTVRHRGFETLPPGDPYRIRTFQVYNNDLAAGITGLIDKAYADRAWLILTFHIIRTPASAQTMYLPADFATVIDYLATKGIPVRAYGDVLASLTRAPEPAAPAATTAIREYTTTQSNIPTPSGILGGYVTCISGGGGGGSGRKGAAGTVRCGGGGGAVAASFDTWIPASVWGATYSVTVGAGGAGGTAVTAADTNGNTGANGGLSSVATGSLAYRTGTGTGGGGGTASAGAGGAASTSGTSAGGGAASATGGAGSSPSTTPAFNAGVGAGGGGITSGDVAGAGGNGGGNLFGVPAVAGGVVAGASPAVGASLGALPGGGGGGGAASTTGNAQDGAAGGSYGGSGAGGGAAVNGVGNSGAGGAGAPGLVRITFVYA